MNKYLKIALIIGAIGVAGFVGFKIYKAIKKAKLGDENNDDTTNDSVTTTIPTEQGRSGSSSQSSDSGDKTPFKNKAEGDAFRRAVNKYKPDYAKEIQLSLSGDYDNSYIRKAWKDYGKLYNRFKQEIEIYTV
jgi:hypothetical protein